MANDSIDVNVLFNLIGQKEVRIVLLEKENAVVNDRAEFMKRKCEEFAQEIDRLKDQLPK